MYSEKDLTSIGEQFRKRLLLWLLPLLLLVAALVYSLVIRQEVLTIAVFVLMCWLVIFAWGLSLAPVRAYQRYIRDLLHGRQREMSGVFKGFDQDSVLRDKVRYQPLMLNVGDLAEPNDDRLLYWDSNLPLPDWREGERLWVSSFDKGITDWRRV